MRLWEQVLAHNAVHAAFAGYTGITVGLVNTHYVYLPIPVVISAPRRVKGGVCRINFGADLDCAMPLWQDVCGLPRLTRVARCGTGCGRRSGSPTSTEGCCGAPARQRKSLDGSLRSKPDLGNTAISVHSFQCGHGTVGAFQAFRTVHCSALYRQMNKRSVLFC